MFLVPDSVLLIRTGFESATWVPPSELLKLDLGGQTLVGQTSVGQTEDGQTLVGQTSVGQTEDGQASVGQTSAGANFNWADLVFTGFTGWARLLFI